MKTPDNSFFTDPVNPEQEARAIAAEAICQLLIWMADGPNLEERGLRTTVALYCVRPDLIAEATLEQIGDASGRSKQQIHTLAEDFRLTTGFKS